MTECLANRVASYYTEAGRTKRNTYWERIAKYKLGPEYEHFYVEPVQWILWSDDRRNQHLNALMRGRSKIFVQKTKRCWKETWRYKKS